MPDRGFRAPARQDRAEARQLFAAPDGSLWAAFDGWAKPSLWHLDARGNRETRLDRALEPMAQARLLTAAMRADGTVVAAFRTGQQETERTELFSVEGDALRPFVILEQEVTELDVDPDGSLLVITGVPRPRLLRLRPDGGRDEAFDAALADLVGDWYALRVHEVRPTGEILLGTYHRDRGSRLMIVSRTGELLRQWEL